MIKNTSKYITLVLVSLSFISYGVSDAYKQKIYDKLEIEGMDTRLKPTIIKTKAYVSDVAGINIPNTVAILNDKGEIALLSFNELLDTKEEVPVPGFPGVWGELKTDPEYKFAWLKRGSGNYFLDTDSKKTGHSVSKYPGSKVHQVVLAEPENMKWVILYSQLAICHIDIYDLKIDEKMTPDYGIAGKIWSMPQHLLLRSTNKKGIKDWVFTNTEINQFTEPKDHLLTKKMTNMEVQLDYQTKPFSYASRTMIGSIDMGDFLKDFSIRWNEDEDEVKIEPFTPLHIPSDIRYITTVGSFSSDGRWFDMTARHKHNGISEPRERFIYNVGDQYPAGISPPIRLGLVESTSVKGAFMMHDGLGPCYVLCDTENPENVIVYKLDDSKKIIIQQLQDYVPVKDNN